MDDADVLVSAPDDAEKVRAIASHMRSIIEALGLDTADPNLKDTHERVAKMYLEMFHGLSEGAEPKVTVFPNDERYTAMIMEKDIPFYSMCAHHFVPFYGHAHAAYIPNEKIVGLSKIPRIVEVFARRLQVQERLTDQIADAVMEVLNPQGVGVVIEAAHLCMMMRGVEKQNSRTVTSAVRGLFRNDSRTRSEFLRLVAAGRPLE